MLFGLAKVDQRVIGTIVAIAIAGVAMLAFYSVISNPTVDSVLHIRGLIDREGFGRHDVVGIALWLVAPISAAVPAWRLTPRASMGDPWAGATLGVLSYGIAVIGGPAIVIVSQVIEEPLLDASGIPSVLVFATAAAAVIMFPLLIVCVVSGQAWASITARVVGRPTRESSVAPIRYGPLIAGIVVFLGLAWVPAVWILGLLAAQPVGVD